MKNKYFLTLLLCLAVAMAFARPVRVACVGNSITYGAGIANREKNSYPAQLQYYLGADYEVRNFGVSGCTLLSKGDAPYIQTAAYKQSLAFAPDVVLIKLGTNDSKPQNICHVDAYKEELRQLVRTYRSLASQPRVMLLTPLRCFLKDKNTINESRIRRQIAPLIQQIAYEEHVEVIDLQRIMGKGWDRSLLPDRLHPSAIGAGRMARYIGEVLLTPRATTPQVTLPKGKSFNFYGHRGVEFTMDGQVSCRLVAPLQAAKGHPWVLRARFWGHEPQTDIALLARGFHIAYCDVTDLYGSPKAVKRWDAFYKQMTALGLNKKVGLEGMSRGGLIVYNWAACHPKQVACIYADAPVMDLKSWPMGKGKGIGSNDDVKRMLTAYGWTSEAEALNWKGNPLNQVRRVKNIPMLHVVGSADDVVPVDENTAIFASKLNEVGVELPVINKEGVGHHPHSLFNPTEIIRFFLKAYNLYINPCTHAVCGNEYRMAAGWTKGSEWHTVAQDIAETLQGRQVDWLWLGNSITQGLGGERKRVTNKPGKAIGDKLMGAGKWETAGISGDRTEYLLWRVQTGAYDACNPKHVVVTIGINNYFDADEPSDVAEGIRAVAEAAKQHFPTATIHVAGLLPAGLTAAHPMRIYYNKVRKALNAMRWKGFDYIDVTDWFVGDDGNMRPHLYNGDGIHLSTQGYEEWCSRMMEHATR